MNTRPRSRVHFAVALALVLLLGAAPLAVADPGDLDPSFGADGMVTTDFNGNYDVGYDVAVDAVGRIVVVGTTALPGYRPDFAVVRYLPDGSLDTAFGGGDGKVETDFAGWDDFANAVVIDSAGRIVVVGTAYTGPGFYRSSALQS